MKYIILIIAAILIYTIGSFVFCCYHIRLTSSEYLWWDIDKNICYRGKGIEYFGNPLSINKNILGMIIWPTKVILYRKASVLVDINDLEYSRLKDEVNSRKITTGKIFAEWPSLKILHVGESG